LWQATPFIDTTLSLSVQEYPTINDGGSATVNLYDATLNTQDENLYPR